jgi:hypothetical protein
MCPFPQKTKPITMLKRTVTVHSKEASLEMRYFVLEAPLDLPYTKTDLGYKYLLDDSLTVVEALYYVFSLVLAGSTLLELNLLLTNPLEYTLELLGKSATLTLSTTPSNKENAAILSIITDKVYDYNFDRNIYKFKHTPERITRLNLLLKAQGWELC